jgi:hypothetical protein
MRRRRNLACAAMGAALLIAEVSRFSPYYGEALKGVAVAVAFEPTRRPVRVLVRLRQVCAKFFRNSFLYY